MKGAVLIVDDNEDAADLLGEILADRGYEVRVAHRSADALALLADFQPTVAILDIGLPIMDGHELARRIHELQPGVRLIAVTGISEPAPEFDEQFLKPVSIAKVMAALERLCR